MTVFDTDGTGKLRQLFGLHLDVGLHHGAQLAVYSDGELVLDEAGGTTGPDGGETTPETRHVLFSCTKPYAGACIHRLVEEGEMGYDDTVREHWPEFADEGTAKAEVTVRHVLSHQAGFPQGAVADRPELWNDWDAVVDSIEELELSFDPGETAAYHSLSYGWAVGELVRRVSGVPVDEYARDEIFEPLGMDDTSIGLVGDDDVAELVGYDDFDRCRKPDAGLELDNKEAAALFNREEVRRAVVPAATGIGTARDMARFYSCLANGGELDGTRVFEEETVERATRLQVEVENDGTLGVPRRYALGFERAGTVWDKYGTLSPERVFGHGGLGSIVGWADPDENLAMAYVTNGIRDEYEHSSRVNAVADAVRSVLAE